MASEEDARKILVQIEYSRRQMEALSKQGQLLESAVAELNATIEALKDISNQKPGAEMMVPVGAGAFVRASLKGTETVLVGVGAEMSVERNMPEAVETLQERMKQLQQSYGSVQKTLGELAMRLQELNSQAEQMIGRTAQQ